MPPFCYTPVTLKGNMPIIKLNINVKAVSFVAGASGVHWVYRAVDEDGQNWVLHEPVRGVEVGGTISLPGLPICDPSERRVFELSGFSSRSLNGPGFGSGLMVEKKVEKPIDIETKI